MRKAITFLETGPTEAFTISQRDFLKERIKTIRSGYSEWVRNTPETREMKNPKTVYETLMELKKWKDELAFCEYVLQ